MMFKFIGKTIVLGALSAGALGFLYGKDQILAWCKQGKEKIASRINEMQGMTAELRDIQSRVGSLEDEVRQLKESAVREEVEVEHLQRETGERKQSLEHLHSNLEKAQSLLGSAGERFVIGGIDYPRAEVERDVAEKIDLYKVQQETLAQLGQTLATHQSALALAKENVLRGEALKAELAGKVRLLEAKLEKQHAKEIYAEAVASDFDAREFDTTIGEVRQLFAKFETKLEIKERTLDDRMKVASNARPGGIDYEAQNRATPSNVLEELSLLLAPKGEPGAAATVVVVHGR